MWNVLILQNILVLGAFSSLKTIGKTSFNVEPCCSANCRHIHQVALQIMRYPRVQRYPGVPPVASLLQKYLLLLKRERVHFTSMVTDVFWKKRTQLFHITIHQPRHQLYNLSLIFKLMEKIAGHIMYKFRFLWLHMWIIRHQANCK